MSDDLFNADLQPERNLIKTAPSVKKALLRFSFVDRKGVDYA
jgi:hypothetical protein